MLPLLAAFAAAPVPTCRIDDAHYALRTQPSVTADFRDAETGPDWPGGLVLRLHVGASGRTYWWVPWHSGSSDGEHLASTTDATAPGWRPPHPDNGPRPLGDVDFMATDSAYNLWNRIPVRGGPAPAHFVIPNLRDALWYRAPGDARDGTARQFFDLVSCRHQVRLRH
jgi:hypothetical protein